MVLPSFLEQAMLECWYDVAQRLIDGGVQAPSSNSLSLKYSSARNVTLQTLQDTQTRLLVEGFPGSAVVCNACTESAADSIRIVGDVVMRPCIGSQACQFRYLLQDIFGEKISLQEAIVISIQSDPDKRTERLAIHDWSGETDHKYKHEVTGLRHEIKRVSGTCAVIPILLRSTSCGLT